MFPNLFCEDSITLLSKSDKDIKRKKSYKPISHEHRYKNPQRTTRELNPKMYKIICHCIYYQVEFIPGM